MKHSPLILLSLLAFTPSTFAFSANRLSDIIVSDTLIEKNVSSTKAADPNGNTASPIPYRGMMIDVSRHFMSIDFLKRQILAMSHFGLTHLHLHLSDAAGWRIESKAYPLLHQMAAWRTDASWKTWWNDGKRHYAEEHGSNAFGGYYTQEEMRELVSYARKLGVEIVPELEFPAHSEEVTAAYPELGCTSQPYECADFCLGNEKTYEFVDKILEEWKDIFSSRFIHLGGDEAGGAHWLECSKCKKVLQEQGISTRQQLQQYAMQRVFALAASKGKTVIAWDEVLPSAETDTASVKPFIMVWRNEQTAQQAMRQGHDVILCPGNYCYLDTYQDAPANEPEAMGGYTPFSKIMKWATEKKAQGPSTEAGRIIGLQANLWTEYVPNERHAERMLWPRALAISKWDDHSNKNLNVSKDKGENNSSNTNGTSPLFWDKKKAQVISEALPWLRAHHITPFPLESEIGQRPEYLTPVHCLSTGKPVRYLAPYHEYYDAGGEKALTDGLRGGWANNDGRWQGFISRNRLDVIVDLRQIEKANRIEATFIQSLGPEIYLPEHITISISQDGEHYTTLYNNACARSELNMDYRTLGWHGSPTSMRFVRFQAKAGDRGGWVFTDEIMVEAPQK